jgi:hypothetical protein
MYLEDKVKPRPSGRSIQAFSVKSFKVEGEKPKK